MVFLGGKSEPRGPASGSHPFIGTPEDLVRAAPDRADENVTFVTREAFSSGRRTAALG